MYDTNFFRDILPGLARSIPEGHVPFVSIIDKRGQILGVERFVYFGTGYVAFQTSRAVENAPSHFLAIQFEDIAFVTLSSLPASESPPEGQSEGGFQIDPATAN